MTEKPNVFILSADALQADYYKRIFSRFRDRLDGVNFDEAIATASATPHSIPTLTTGVYADFHDGVGLPEQSPQKTLAEIFSNEGYQCSLWSDNAFFGQEYNYDRGFDNGMFANENTTKKISNLLRGTPFYKIAKSVYFNVLNRRDNTTLYSPAKSLHNRALNWLEETGDGPTFCWIHYMDTHHPFEPPSEYISDKAPINIAKITREVIKNHGEGYSDAEISATELAYDGSCRYLHDEVNSFLDLLLESGHYEPDRDILIFTADHGEILDPEPYGMMGHTPVTAWEELISVPLYVAAPQWDSKTISEQVSLIDFPGLVCCLAGVDTPERMSAIDCETPDGLIRDQTFVVNDPMWGTTFRGIRTSNEKLFAYRTAGLEHRVVYEDLETGEIRTVSGTDITQLPEASHLHEALLNELGPLVERSDEVDIDSEVQEHLDDLGYLDV